MRFVPVPIAIICAAAPALAQIPDTVFLEELTWTEVREAVHSGKTTIIIPTGGTGQNGPHMVLGKHNYYPGPGDDWLKRQGYPTTSPPF